MKITIDYKDNINDSEINVIDAKYLGDYTIRIYFNTNENRVVDFKPFLMKAVHPAIKKYIDENLFKSYKIENGNLNWNDYDLIFPINDLYTANTMKFNNTALKSNN